jgi:hypothetical protein
MEQAPMPLDRTTPGHINPVQWQQAQGIARQTCARVFRDGGTPEDALDAFGLSADETASIDWSRAVDAIAQTLCMTPHRRAA